MKVSSKKKHSLIEKFILGTEKVGNKIPNPLAMFILFSMVIFVISIFTSGIEISIPDTDTVLITKSLATKEFVRGFLQNLPNSYVSFPPIKLVLIMSLGIALCEYTGLFEASIKRALKNVPSALLTAIIITIGVNGNLAGDPVYIVLPSLAAVIFMAKGRNPLIGVIAAYASIGGAFNAAFLVGSVDAILAGITESASQILPAIANYNSHVAMNYYFLLISSIVLIPVGTYVTEKIVAPIVEKSNSYKIDDDYVAKQGAGIEEITPIERKGIRNAGIAILIFLAVLLVLLIPQGSLFRNPETGEIVPNSPFMNSIPVLLSLLFFIPGLTYGMTIKKIKNTQDIASMMSKGISSMAPFLTMVFGAVIFSEFFKYTNLATLIAFRGANTLQAANITGIPLILIVIVFVAFLNILIISSSAKWAIIAPIFVPLLAIMGFTPAFAQAVYRVGGSVTDIISPLHTALPIILGVMTRYKKDTGIGTVISLTMPYTIVFAIVWTLVVIAFMVLNIPIGPGTFIYL